LIQAPQQHLTTTSSSPPSHRLTTTSYSPANTEHPSTKTNSSAATSPPRPPETNAQTSPTPSTATTWKQHTKAVYIVVNRAAKHTKHPTLSHQTRAQHPTSNPKNEFDQI
jgi:hypothetical protein